MATLTAEQFQTLLNALSDAADYRIDGPEGCADCDGATEYDDLCVDHQNDSKLATEYGELQHFLATTRSFESITIGQEPR